MPRPRRERIEPKLATVPGRNKWYIVWTDEHGRSRRQSTGVPVAPGRTASPPIEAQQALDHFIEGLDAPTPDITVAELLDRRLEDLRARIDPPDLPKDTPKSRRPSHRYENAHNALKKELGHLAAHQLTKARLTRYGQRHQWRRKVGVAFTELKAAYNLAGVEAPEFPKVPSRPPRDRFIPREAARRMIDHAPFLHIKVYLVLAFLSGQRRGAILDLTWDRVNLETGTVDFNDPHRPMTDKRRAVVHLDRRGLVLLREADEMRRSNFVVEYQGRGVHDIKKGFHAAASAAGVPWATPHHTKHSVISWLAEDGWQIDQIADYTNTNRETVRRVYRKVNPDALAGMSQALGDSLFGANPVRKVK